MILMQRPLQKFWEAIGEKGYKAALFRWKILLEHEYDVFRSFLRPTNEKATSHFCPAAGQKGCPRIIEKGECGNMFAVCNSQEDYQCRPIQLPVGDAVIYEVDWHKLGKLTAEILGIKFQYETIPGFNHTFKIGDYMPLAHRRYPIYLCMKCKPEHFKVAIMRLCNMHNQGQFMVITLALKDVDRDTIEVSAKEGASILYLNDILVRKPDGRIYSALPAEKLLEEFHTKVMPVTKTPAEKSTTDNMITFPTPSGALWGEISIRFTNAHTIIIECNGVAQKRDYMECGMVNTKNKSPSKQWELLYEFALRYGELNIPLQHKSKYEKRKQLLCKDINRLFAGMEGEPITSHKRGDHTYKTRFLVRVAS